MAGKTEETQAVAGTHFGRFGGIFVPETLIGPLAEVEDAYEEARKDASFQTELTALLRDYVGRPTPLYLCRRLAEQCGGAKIYLKREDLCHTGSHKLNNALGQALLARRMGRTKLMAETGAGQHGVATATLAAFFGMECDIYMGEEDVRRQALNVYRMRLLGANVIEVDSGSRTLKDAINEAFRVWMATAETTYYLFGTAAGPHPYPAMVPTSSRSSVERRGSRFSPKRAVCPPIWWRASVAGAMPSACSTRFLATTCGWWGSKPPDAVSRQVRMRPR
jgi:tryptophan synthase beta chain